MSELLSIANKIHEQDGICLIVGGSVRDEYFGVKSKDLDIEVYGLAHEKLVNILQGFGKVSVVGESFGVTKLTTNHDEYDFSLPRKDNKVAKGHKGFIVETDCDLSPQAAAARRDYTINSMGKNLLSGQIHDYYNGHNDLVNRLLRATSEQFVEDPLRVLRGFQFAGRFDMQIEENTAMMAWSVFDSYDELPKERVFSEFYKWAEKSTKPSAGLQFLLDCGWISLFPELSALIDVEQDFEYHPEGNVWDHTLHVCDAMVEILNRENVCGEDRVVLVLAALCHDLGKAVSSEKVNGRWRSPGHAQTGVPISEQFLNSIGCFPSIIERVLPLVAEHMVHVGLKNPSANVVKRLSLRLKKAKINELMWIIEADHSGRPPLPKGLPEVAGKIQEIAKKLKLETGKPIPLVQGRHLIEMGMKPGPIFGRILSSLFEDQINDYFDTLEGGLDRARALSQAFNPDKNPDILSGSEKTA